MTITPQYIHEMLDEAAKHQRVGRLDSFLSLCRVCGRPWPCLVVSLASEYHALRTQQSARPPSRSKVKVSDEDRQDRLDELNPPPRTPDWMTDTHAADVQDALDRQERFRNDGSLAMNGPTAWRDAQLLAAEVARLREVLAVFDAEESEKWPPT